MRPRFAPRFSALTWVLSAKHNQTRNRKLEVRFPIPGIACYLRHVAMSISTGSAIPETVSMKLVSSALKP